MPESLLPWVLFNAFVLLLLGLDLFVFHRKARTIHLKEALAWCLFWESLALLFNVYIYYSRGLAPALNFLTGYLIEKSLSLDNLFVFVLVFKSFHTPKADRHKILFWGVLGAMVMRALFIFLGIALITRFHWVIYLFGLFLIYTALQLWRKPEKEIHPEHNPLLRFFPGASPFFATLIVIENVDVIFALDSIPAILAITTDPFIVYTSNIFAILGLRALYFVLEHMMGLFPYLHRGLAVILLFIGSKMLLEDVFPIPTNLALGFVLLVLASSILLPKRN
jgi:tellurite resistance protein TerC